MTLQRSLHNISAPIKHVSRATIKPARSVDTCTCNIQRTSTTRRDCLLW